jgi:hypothetical protein
VQKRAGGGGGDVEEQAGAGEASRPAGLSPDPRRSGHNSPALTAATLSQMPTWGEAGSLSRGTNWGEGCDQALPECLAGRLLTLEGSAG